MYEKDLVINGRELKYKGIFRADELFVTINQALEQKNYVKQEKKTEELVTEEGRRTYVELRPLKSKSSVVTLMLKIKITLNNVTETRETIDSEKRKFQQGDVNIVFDSWYLADYDKRCGMKPFVFFMRGLINKVFYQFPLEKGFRSELVSDTAYVYAQIKKLFESYHPALPRVVMDEEVRRKVAEEIESGLGEE